MNHELSQQHRVAMLAALRQPNLTPTPLPSLDGPWIEYPDRERQFAQSLTSVGGHCQAVDDREHLAAALSGLAEFQAATQRVCWLPHWPAISAQLGGTCNVTPNTFESAHELAHIDWAVVAGEFGVAENGAVWVNAAGLRHRALYFIVQHLVIVLPRTSLVNHLHEAYERLSFHENHFGCFISGPSKTADIEQSLVIGAHGARSLVVMLY